MKKLFAVCILTILLNNVHAQQLSLGLRTGTACWTEGKNRKGYEVQSLHIQSHTWDNEIFARFATKGKWAFETGLVYTYINGKPSFASPFIATEEQTTVRNYEWNISAQYDVTCSYMQRCPIMRSLRSYIGISVSPVWSNVVANYQSFDPPPGYSNATWQTDYTFIEVWAGLSHTMIYNLGKHVMLTSVFDFKMAPGRFFSHDYSSWGYSPTTRTGIRLGAAYKL